MLKQFNRGRKELDDVFSTASRLWDEGKVRAALRLFLKAATRGDLSSQLNVGYMYDVGVGVRRNREQAMYWYKRAYRRGAASAAINIGTIYRNEADARRAEQWFLRALELRDDSGAFELGKLLVSREPVRASKFFQRAAGSKKLDAASVATARKQLVLLEKRLRRRSG